jgi:apolipoprotein N-acyltransferase
MKNAVKGLKGLTDKRSGTVFLCYAFSAVLLTLIQVPGDGGILAWVCLVPFITAAMENEKVKGLYWWAFAVGFGYWLGNLYWVGYVAPPGYVLLSFYLGLYWPVNVFLLRGLVKRFAAPLPVATAVVFTGAEAWRGILLTGFSWRLLGHSQYGFNELIQIADITGVLGISFIVAFANGVVAVVMKKAREGRLICRKVGFYVLAAAVLIAGSVGYGLYRRGEYKDYEKQTPIIGSVQPNIPSAVKDLADNGPMILQQLLELGSQAYEAGAKLVLWPETIVLASMNPGYVDKCREGTPPTEFHKLISDHTQTFDGYLLFGGHAADLEVVGNEYEIVRRYNSAYLYRPDGNQAGNRYDKIHLVPFGEYFPWRGLLPGVDSFIRWLSPEYADYDLTPGSNYKPFEVDIAGRNYRFGVMICYDDTDDDLARRLVYDNESAGKRVDFLANISNDGWYVRFANNEVEPSVELPQRTIISAFRAIENRVPVIRSVNTGISCSINSLGEIQDGFLTGTLREEAMKRQGHEGYFTARLVIDPRVSFFSRYGPVIKKPLAVVYVLVIMVLIVSKHFAKGDGKAKNCGKKNMQNKAI